MGGPEAPAFFVFASLLLPRSDDVAVRKRQVIDAYRGGKWRLPELMAKILAANEFCMDAISRVCAPHYRRGRVALVGDTAIAFDRYEAKYRDYVSVSQKMNAGRLLAPRIPLGIVGRNLLFSTPTVFSPAMKAFGRVLRTFIV